MKQISLFKDLKAPGDGALLIRTNSNNHVFEWIENWPSVHDLMVTYLIGPQKSGKKTLATLWAKRTNAELIDINNSDYFLKNLNAIDHSVVLILGEVVSSEQEVFLFHLFNHLKNRKKHILLVSSKKYEPSLADLKSRFLTAHVVELPLADEETLKALYFKFFYDFGIKIPKEVIDFLMTHFERTFEKAYEISHKLNDFSVQEGRSITIPLIKNIFNI